jgi:hypothetical protein
MKDPQHDKLVTAQARLQQHREVVSSQARVLVRNAQAKLDSMAETIHEVEQHVRGGLGGGILAQRRLKTLLSERQELIEFLAEHEHRLDGHEHESDDES